MTSEHWLLPEQAPPRQSSCVLPGMGQELGHPRHGHVLRGMTLCFNYAVLYEPFGYGATCTLRGSRQCHWVSGTATIYVEVSGIFYSVGGCV